MTCSTMQLTGQRPPFLCCITHSKVSNCLRKQHQQKDSVSGAWWNGIQWQLHTSRRLLCTTPSVGRSGVKCSHWTHVLQTDESHFTIWQADGQVCVWWMPEEHYPLEPTVPTVKCTKAAENAKIIRQLYACNFVEADGGRFLFQRGS